MLILSIDTSGDICTVALGGESGLVSQLVFRHRMDLLQRLASNVKWLIEDARLSMGRINAVAVSLGPGSFTGLRIGVTTAKGLAYAAGKPIIGIPTLDVLAEALKPERGDAVIPLIMARPGEVYADFYRRNDDGQAKLTSGDSMEIEEMLDRALGLKGGHVFFCGSGAKANRAIIEERLGSRAIFAHDWLDYPNGDVMCRLALRRLQSGQMDDVLALAPLYLRKPTPQVALEAKKAK